MKNPIMIVSFLVISFTAACKKDDGSNTSGKSSNVKNNEGGGDATLIDDVPARLESAKEFFKNRDFQAALSELDAALTKDPKNPEFLNLRGSCYVGMRDFEKALNAFTEASIGAPQNSSIMFNIGEVHFVTKQWNEAITAFEESKNLLKPEQTLIRDLIEFKILLCHAGLQNWEEYARLSSNIHDSDDTLRSYFTKASLEYHSNNENKAQEILAEAERAFPDKQQRAVWEDTMAEFGYNH